MRATFSSILTQLAMSDPKVLLLTGDHGYALFDEFRNNCPAQFINAGVAEQNMVGMAAGLAKMGFKPFVYGLSAFVPVRVVEQIKLDIAHDALHVTLIGDGAGFVYSHLGTSHQSTEDIACTRAIPNLNIMSPADRYELKACMMFAYNKSSATYLRMGKCDLGDVHTSEVDEATLRSPIPCKIKNSSEDEKNIVFFATGSMVKVACHLATEHYSNATVYSIPVIKPLLEEDILHLCQDARVIVVMEEHSIIGGLSGAILEACSSVGLPPLLRIGVKDRFSSLCGSYEYLLQEHGLNMNQIWKDIDQFLEKN